MADPTSNQFHRVLADVFRHTRQHTNLRPVRSDARRFRCYQWADDYIRVSIRVGRAGAELTIRQRLVNEWEIIARCNIGAWQQALDILAAYGAIPDSATSGYRRGVADTRREPANA